MGQGWGLEQGSPPAFPTRHPRKHHLDVLSGHLLCLGSHGQEQKLRIGVLSRNLKQVTFITRYDSLMIVI